MSIPYKLDILKVKSVNDLETSENILVDEYAGLKRLEDSEVEKCLGDLNLLMDQTQRIFWQGRQRE